MLKHMKGRTYMYNVYIAKAKNIRPAENADRLNLCEVFGNTTVVDKSVNENDLYVYFPVDGKLAEDFCELNHLCRKKKDGSPDTGYLDPDKRNIVAIKLRGNRSDGLLLPLSSLASYGDISKLAEGDIVTIFNGHVIAEKYIPRSNHRTSGGTKAGNRTRKVSKNIYPYFVEHIDTPQLRFNMSMFKPGDYICLTEKVHGTSSRNGYTLVQPETKWYHKLFHLTPKTKYEEICGSRRTIIENVEGGFYGSNAFRLKWEEKFKGKLLPGEMCFGEIAGYAAENQPIMGIAKNNKTKDKEFIKKYGEETVFSYGCEPNGKQVLYGCDDISHFKIEKKCPLNRYFIYRMTYTTPEGQVIEYPWDLVKLRAEQMGFEVVPELERFIYTTEEDFLSRITKYLDIPSTIDSRHIIEGVVIRALNAVDFKVAKEKSWNFKVIEGIISAQLTENLISNISDDILSEI